MCTSALSTQSDGETATSVFSFTPASGVLGPQESQEIAVLFKPSEIGLVGRVRTVLQCDVKNGNPRYLKLLIISTALPIHHAFCGV